MSKRSEQQTIPLNKRLRNFQLILFLMMSGTVLGQEYIYVNTNNLLLRDRPEKKYNVSAVLYAPSQLEMLPYDREFVHNRAVTDRFYEVRFTHYIKEGTETWYGWVEKRYTVPSKDKISVPGADTILRLDLTEIPAISYMGSADHDPNKTNYAAFPYPKYKGGEKHFDPPVKKVYHSGPRGGCYYLDSKGHKKYVNAKLCK